MGRNFDDYPDFQQKTRGKYITLASDHRSNLGPNRSSEVRKIGQFIWTPILERNKTNYTNFTESKVENPVFAYSIGEISSLLTNNF